MAKVRKHQNSLDLDYMISMQNATVYASEDYHRIARAIAFMRQHHL
jgi:hypothetical protein